MISEKNLPSSSSTPPFDISWIYNLDLFPKTDKHVVVVDMHGAVVKSPPFASNMFCASKNMKKILPGTVIISGLMAQNLLKTKWNASDEAVKYWMTFNFTALKKNTPDENGEIEIDTTKKNLYSCFFIKQQIEDFKPTDSNTLINFEEILKWPAFEKISRDILRQCIISVWRTESLKLLDFTPTLFSSFFPYEISASNLNDEDQLGPYFFIREDVLMFAKKYGKGEVEEIRELTAKEKVECIFLEIRNEYLNEKDVPATKIVVVTEIYKRGIHKRFWDPQSDKERESNLETIKRTLSLCWYKEHIEYLKDIKRRHLKDIRRQQLPIT